MKKYKQSRTLLMISQSGDFLTEVGLSPEGRAKDTAKGEA
jgi:hypothetical protein